jgi:hypothetical protein
MGLNIYNLYITRSKPELEYFKKLVHFLSYVELKETHLQVVHLDFKSKDSIPNIKYNLTKMIATVYTFSSAERTVYQTVIYNLDNLISLYKHRSGPNVFIYTGHSDGMYLVKKKVRILRIEDFCELTFKVNKGVKADLMIFDCCLCGNIGALYLCYNFTNYVIGSTSYQSYLSLLHTHCAYRFNGNIVNYAKEIIKELGNKEKSDDQAYDSNFSLYSMNEHLLKLIDLVLQFKNRFDYRKSFVIDYSYYKDIECLFKELAMDINGLLDKIVVFNRYQKQKCINRKLHKKKDYSIPSKLMIVLKRPIRTDLGTSADIFLLKP